MRLYKSIMNESYEWVEIIEPAKRDHMFANLKTGQCSWDRPIGVDVKPLGSNQWWELYDLKTKRYYYFNATTQKTVWKKPNDGDIIPLAKLQMLKHKEFNRRSSLSSVDSNQSSKKEVIYSNLDLSSKLQTDATIENIMATSLGPIDIEKSANLSALSFSKPNENNSNSSLLHNDSFVNEEKNSNSNISETSPPLYGNYKNSNTSILTSSSMCSNNEQTSIIESSTDPSTSSINTTQQTNNKSLYENVIIPSTDDTTREMIYDVPKADQVIAKKPVIQEDKTSDSKYVEYVNTSNLFSSDEEKHVSKDTNGEKEVNDILSQSNEETSSVKPVYDVFTQKSSTLPRGKVTKMSEKPRFGSLRLQAPPKPPRTIPTNKESFLGTADSHSINFEVTIQKSPQSERKAIERPKRQPPQAPAQTNQHDQINMVSYTSSISPTPKRNALKTLSTSPVPARRPDISSKTKSMYGNRSPDSVSITPPAVLENDKPLQESSPREHRPSEGMIQEGDEEQIIEDIKPPTNITPLPAYLAQKRVTPGRQGDGVLSIYDNLTHSIYDNFSSEYSEEQTSTFSTMSTSPSKSFDMSASSNEVLTTPTGSSLLRSETSDNRTSFYERLKDNDVPVDASAKDASPRNSPQSSISSHPDIRTPPKRTPLTRMKSDSSDIEKRAKFSKSDQNQGSFRPVSMLNLSVKPRRSHGSESDLPDQVALSKHRRGFLRKRISIHCMLSWSKTPIRKPMVLTRDKHLRKEAVDVFKLILQYMGDKSTRKSQESLSIEITTKGWANATLRDEIFIQLCKQTTSNERQSSLLKGWEMITACLSFFPPSNKFHSYLEGYISRHLDNADENEAPEDVQVYAKHCHKQLERICQVGAKRGLKGPSAEEIQAAIKRAFNPSMFGNTLEDIMTMQQERFPDYRLPWILTCLTEAVLLQNGLQTEGIFRVPGDIDEVNALKLSMDSWMAPSNLNDPHAPASLLKLWFRDLYEPLIPQRYYDQCIHNCDNEDVCLNIVNSLPDLNNTVFCYLIRLLQAFMIDENVSYSKMDANNLAMVWAPNCLRCPSDDPLEIFENTRKEMTFLRTVMQSLDTSFLEGVL